jgi:hypothetical protein
MLKNLKWKIVSQLLLPYNLATAIMHAFLHPSHTTLTLLTFTTNAKHSICLQLSFEGNRAAQGSHFLHRTAAFCSVQPWKTLRKIALPGMQISPSFTPSGQNTLQCGTHGRTSHKTTQNCARIILHDTRVVHAERFAAIWHHIMHATC